MTLPSAIRDDLARLVLESFHDAVARRRLQTFACPGGDPHSREAAERAGRARRALADRPFDPPDAPLATALAQSAILFDARLYFEVHERLEPYWMRTEGGDRVALQGLIQVAVGLHHLGNGNVAGARSLLHDGAAKLAGRRLEGIELDPFAAAVVRCLDEVNRLGADAPAQFDWGRVPRFAAPDA